MESQQSLNLKPSRDAVPEIYRVALMFGICLLHSNGAGDYLHPWLSNILASCVDGFVFISGYYGLKFRPSKVLGLYGTAIFSGAIILALLYLFDLYTFEATMKTVLFVRHRLCNAWFVSAYLFLMLLAPFIDAALERLPNRLLPSVLLPFALLTFGWSFGVGLPVVGPLLPNTAGLGAYTGLTLLSVYVTARLCRRFDVMRFFTWKRACVVLPLLWFCTAIGFGEYSSPFAVALCGVMFYVFKACPWPTWCGRVALLLGPSMFAVYLLHTNEIGFPAIKHLEACFIGQYGLNSYLGVFITALLIFVACILVDSLRRGILLLLAPVLRSKLQRIDALYFKIAPDR